jgi:hypothetical protein
MQFDASLVYCYSARTGHRSHLLLEAADRSIKFDVPQGMSAYMVLMQDYMREMDPDLWIKASDSVGTPQRVGTIALDEYAMMHLTRFRQP